MATALVSALTGRCVDQNLAMTGEITLRGRVLAIGGLKEKLLAAKRAGIDRVLIPKDNEKHLEEVPAGVRRALRILPVGHMDEVLAEAIQRHPEQRADMSEPGFHAGPEASVHH
jgi:ATP-dependent Lon protease